MGFAPSLHPLSIVDGIRASARRTPRRTAVLEQGSPLSYAELLAAAAAGPSHASVVVRWLAGLMADPALDEDRPVAPRMASHREIVLRALDVAVRHPVFDREGAVASTLPLDSELGMVAATLALWLGNTLVLAQRPEAIQRIAAGTVQACWLSRGDCAALDAAALAGPAPGFRLALCEGAPPEALARWLGPGRVCEGACEAA